MCSRGEGVGVHHQVLLTCMLCCIFGWVGSDLSATDVSSLCSGSDLVLVQEVIEQICTTNLKYYSASVNAFPLVMEHMEIMLILI